MKKVSIGGDRIGSGGKMTTKLRHYNRSNHNLSEIFRSSMSAGTLVPFLTKVGLPGDSWEIDLSCEVLTLPTVGPLFGSYKVQLDVFEVPMRLYNAQLHMNKLNIGRDMSAVKLPQIELLTNNHADYIQTFDDNEQINPSCLLKYLGISGLGAVSGSTNPAKRQFNAVPLLSFWDIYKNYYANKQEDDAWFIHVDGTALDDSKTPTHGYVYQADGETPDFEIVGVANENSVTNGRQFQIFFPANSPEINPDLKISVGGGGTRLDTIANNLVWNEDTKSVTGVFSATTADVYVKDEPQDTVGEDDDIVALDSFPLTNIDNMKEAILQHPSGTAFVLTALSIAPYGTFMDSNGVNEALKYSMQYSQEGLPVKTYQSDLFNNWISTEWIDGVGGINDITSVDTTGNSFTIDSLNLAQKVYIMLNRIAVSGGSYDDWLAAVYTHERKRAVESPVYHGSLIKELAFQEVVSNSEANDQPLGTLAGRGRLTDKHKGGKIKIKCDEHCYIMGLVSLTPRIDYSQGNKWDMNLKTFDDFHKPQLDAIGYQDLITDQMLWTDTGLDSATSDLTFKTLGKQPAWINYMTAVNRVYGNFAIQTKEQFMVNNRRFTANENTGALIDGTTYIDPTKFNNIFAQTSLDSQNYWVQIKSDITARRLMSAKVIPNL